MISIILATKNGALFIDRAIESVLTQTEQDLELIVVSDGSTDNTVEKINTWIAKDSRVKLIELKENIGPGLARDKGIKESHGDYIAIIDDDDYWISKDKLKLQRDFLEKNPDHILVGSAHTTIVDEENVFIKKYNLPLSDEEIRKEILIRNCFITTSVMFKKEAYLQVGGFAPLYLAEDYDLWLRMGLIGKFANIEHVDIAYTQRANSASNTRKLELYKSVLTIVKNNVKKYPNGFLGVLKGYARIVLFKLKQLT